jgi:ABC-type antimicrobial peptide transport system, permease component
VLAPQLRRAVASLDSDLPVYEIHTARKHLQIDLGDLSVFGDILGGFAVAGLILSGIGIFGVISYSGAQRTSEVGIRMALGAPRIKVVWAVLRYAFTWTLVGTVCGFGGAIGLSYLLASKMAWLPKPDLATSFASMTCLVVVAIAASFIPASRVSRIDPVIALRHE